MDVEYLSSTTWQIETIECRLPGDLGLRTEKIKVEGISDETRAWRYGMRRRRQQVYQRKRYSFSTELDALNSGYLDYALLGDTTPGYGQSAMLKGFAPMGESQQIPGLFRAAHLDAWRRALGGAAPEMAAPPDRMLQPGLMTIA